MNKRNKEKKQINVISLCIILLTYYVYFNSLRKILIPFSNIIIPLIVILIAIVPFFYSKNKIKFTNNYEKIICFTWILISLLLSFNSNSFYENLLNGGLIQLFSLVAFTLFASDKKEWIHYWIKYTKIFVLIHAIATIIFYFNSGLYMNFACKMFDGQALTAAIHYYKSGYMSGLCTHFSSNGMIMSIGLLIILEDIRNKNTDKKKKIFSYSYLVIVAYALLLTSKRSPLIAIIICMIVTLILSQGKKVLKTLVTLGIAFAIISIGYNYLANIIPGLSTISDKAVKLKNSSAGILNGRDSLWKIAIEMYKNHPILGNGYGSYKIISESNNAITTSAHNYYLQILAEQGLVGFLLYINAFVFGLIYAAKAFLKELKNNNQKNICITSLSFNIQLFVLIYSFTATSLMYYYILIPYFLSIASIRYLNINKLEGENL